MPSWLKEGRGSLCGANVSLLLREMGITKVGDETIRPWVEAYYP